MRSSSRHPLLTLGQTTSAVLTIADEPRNMPRSWLELACQPALFFFSGSKQALELVVSWQYVLLRRAQQIGLLFRVFCGLFFVLFFCSTYSMLLYKSMQCCWVE